MTQTPDISDPREHRVQVALTASWQLGHVVERLLSYTGPASLTVSTYSVGEEFLRRLIRLRQNSLLRSAELYCDLKAAEKTASLRLMMRSAYDCVHLCQNHSKVAVIQGELPVVVLTSQNQTRGNRLENYTILQSRAVAEQCLASLRALDTYDL